MTRDELMHLFAAIAIAGWVLWRTVDLLLAGYAAFTARPTYPRLTLAAIVAAVVVAAQTGLIPA